jgi:putative NADH-flavin reductase
LDWRNLLYRRGEVDGRNHPRDALAQHSKHLYIEPAKQRDLLERTKTAERGSNVAVTTAGRTALQSARPVHAHSVRRYLIERLTPDQVAAILVIGGDTKGAIEN